MHWYLMLTLAGIIASGFLFCVYVAIRANADDDDSSYGEPEDAAGEVPR